MKDKLEKTRLRTYLRRTPAPEEHNDAE